MQFAAPETLLISGFKPLLAEVSMTAEPVIKSIGWLTNSVFVAGIVVLLILWASRKATKNLQTVPSGFQNFFEFTVEFLYSQVEEILGKKITPRVFPLLATLFIYILIANWFGLVPGVGTIGFGELTGPLTLKTAVDAEGHAPHIVPLLRPATADVNLTLGMAACFMLVWIWLTYTELGVIGFLKHTFAPKGGVTGLMGKVLIPIFLFVGVIELISIALRPVSLSLRLFGNVFAGENLLHMMGGMLDNAHPVLAFLGSIALPLPFYFMELLVGVLQAMVFALLCAVYIQLSTSHEEDH